MSALGAYLSLVRPTRIEHSCICHHLFDPLAW